MVSGAVRTGKNSYDLLVGVMVVLTTIVCSTPLLEESEFLVPSFLLGIILLLFQIDSHAIKKNASLIFGNLLYVGLVLFYKVFGISGALWTQLFQHLSFFFFAIFMLLIPVRSDSKYLKWAFVLSALVVLFNIGDNIYLSIKYPLLNISRRYVEANVPEGINAGRSIFFAFVLFFFMICFFQFLNRTKRPKKSYHPLVLRRGRLIWRINKKRESRSAFWSVSGAFMFFCCLVSGTYICGFCNKASVVVLFFLSLLLLILGTRHRSGPMFFFYSGIVGVMALLVIFLFKDVIVDIILALSPSERLSGRLILLVDSENVEASDSSFSGRQFLWRVSFDTWTSSIQNFLFGIGDHRSTVNPVGTGIGQHSDLVDSLARYGVLGFVIIVNAVARNCKYILSIFPKKCHMQLLSFFVVLVISSVSKLIFFPGCGCAFFLLLPLVSCFIETKGQTTRVQPIKPESGVLAERGDIPQSMN